MKYLPVGIIIASSLMNPTPVLATTNDAQMAVSYTHLTLPTTPYV